MQVVEHAPCQELAKLFELLSTCAELTDAGYLEVLYLAMHVGQEEAQVLWDFLISNQILSVVSSIELSD